MDRTFAIRERRSDRRGRARGRVAAALCVLATGSPAFGTFHFMQIEQVIGSVNGDPSAQAIQLRMRVASQNLVDRGRLVAWDAAGENPVVLIDFQTAVSGTVAGSRVLATSEGFIRYTQPREECDFVLSNLIPESYLAAGSLTFETDEGDFIVWRVSWGGDAYTGPTHGALTNDGDGEFGPPVEAGIGFDAVQSLSFTGAADDLSTSNAADYEVITDEVVLTNNAGQTFTVSVPTCPAGPGEDMVDDDGDGTGNICDLCSADPNKTAPGLCGCGMPDVDANGDPLTDCDDPGDPPGGGDPPDGGGGDPDGGDPGAGEGDGGDPPDDGGGADGDGNANGDGGAGGDAEEDDGPCGMGALPFVMLSFLWLGCVRLGRRGWAIKPLPDGTGR